MIERAPSQPTGASQGRGPDVPPDLADLACARLLAASVDERESVLAELCRLHGDHAAGLRHLHAELMGADRMLQENLVPPAADELRSVGPFAVVRRLGEGA